jgi:hypothetical protein
MKKTCSSTVLLMLAALTFTGMLAIAGCSKTEPPPEGPPPVTKGNPKCTDDSGDCKITTADIAAQTGAQHECGAQFDVDTAIHVTADGSAGYGKFKGIYVKKDKATEKDFELTIKPCDNAPADPFTYKPNGKLKEWKSGKVKSGIPEGSRYQLVLAQTTGKGKNKKMTMADPHIVIDKGITIKNQ